MGPLALADLIGLDTCVAIMDVLHEGSATRSTRRARCCASTSRPAGSAASRARLLRVRLVDEGSRAGSTRQKARRDVRRDAASGSFCAARRTTNARERSAREAPVGNAVAADAAARARDRAGVGARAPARRRIAFARGARTRGERPRCCRGRRAPTSAWIELALGAGAIASGRRRSRSATRSPSRRISRRCCRRDSTS
jgi:hypothetical protein